VTQVVVVIQKTACLKEANEMRKVIVALVVLVFIASLQVANAEPKWKTHKAECLVKYPGNFKARTTLYGSYFTSPDGQVEFYAFHRWMSEHGRPQPWLAQPNEKMIRTSQGPNHREYGFIHAKDRSYSRDYVVISDGVTPWRVFYIRYKSASALMKYQKAYNRFIASYRQSGDGDDCDGR